MATSITLAPLPATIGPWYVTECEDFIRVRQESSDAVLATMEDGGHPELELVPWYERMANARLFAAAPDLLVAATRALDALSKLDAGDTKVASELRNAIAKAATA